MSFSGGSDKPNNLIVRMLTDISAVDHENLVALIQARKADVSRTPRGNSANDNRIMLVGTSLKNLPN